MARSHYSDNDNYTCIIGPRSSRYRTGMGVHKSPIVLRIYRFEGLLETNRECPIGGEAEEEGICQQYILRTTEVLEKTIIECLTLAKYALTGVMVDIIPCRLMCQTVSGFSSRQRQVT